ncbi:PREDICTED: flavonol synthase/flavanone 3-hydroxylase-like [Erythranthe guttata]|uniref:flavonol synthase/flavanone 3-hydroxylase-like n=1 Tax=Erythranthe guttata TaxID=4155 RepID=UPI00064DFBA1|nr:PREDICTED: flavonol synthase/flavanone 3-hydroxylase-like [Erythranthe guttata]|eukprot:XP_012833886.1 PREDICTED: flavonol synthase/flavanone 3-hydroxylase-like [Erythranthe guttata]
MCNLLSCSLHQLVINTKLQIGKMAEKKDNNNHNKNNTSFTSAIAVSQMSIRNIPRRYILPLPHRPTLITDHKQQHCFSTRASLPIIDLSSLDDPLLRSRIVDQVSLACEEFGFFQGDECNKSTNTKCFVQVTNHGIPVSFTKDALDVAKEFFDLPNETKMRIASADIHKPVRYGTSLNHIKDKVQYWRDFIKHYSHPISTWVDSWPSDPPTYK